MEAELFHRIGQVQRQWRRRLSDLEKPCHALAAHMLLFLDDPGQCLGVAVQWLRGQLDADRVDAGFCAPGAASYTPAVEALRSSAVPSLAGARFDTADPLVRRVLASQQAVAIADVRQERLITEQVREALLHHGCEAKLAIALRGGHRPLGLLCADWSGRGVRLQQERQDLLQETVDSVISPILWQAQRIRQHSPTPGDAFDALTPAEQRVAELVSQGLSYKEIARRLGRSPATVDHQLRSIRIKLDVPSTARLVSLLSQHRPAQDLLAG